MLLLVAILVLGGGEDVAPVVGSAVTGTPAQGTTAANGTLAAQPGAPPAPSEAPVESSASGSTTSASSPSAPASTADTSAAYSNEQTLNAQLTPPPGLVKGIGTAPLSNPTDTPEDVSFVGQKLEIVADQVDQCLADGGKDIFDCLGKLPDGGFSVVRIFETEPQGARIVVKGAEHVILIFRGGTRCRMLGTSTDCNAWSATSD